MLIEPGPGGRKHTPGEDPDVEAPTAQARIAKIKAHQRAWREKNKDRIREYMERWKANNQEKLRVYRKRHKSGCTPTMLMGLLAAQEGKCALCGEALVVNRHLDHVIPRSKGGKSELGNYQYLCPTCNVSKGAQTNDEFIAHIGKILKFIGQ